MRVSKDICKFLQTNIKNTFGDVNVYLFGSRTDDSKKGGDIDLAIQSNLSRLEFRKKKVLFLSTLAKENFSYGVDVVDFNTKDELLRSEIEKNHIKLF